MYNIFIRNRGWISLVSCALTLLVAVTVTDSQSLSDGSLAWPYHYYAPAFSHSESPVVLQAPYPYLGTNRDRRILSLFKKGAGPQLVIRKKDSGHGHSQSHSSHGHGHGHGWGHKGGSSHSSGSKKGGGLLKGWLPKKSFGVHVTGGLGFSFGGKEEEKKEEHHGWQPVKYGWGSYGHGHQSHGHKGWGSYHQPSNGWGHYHSKHGQHSYGWGGYDDEYSYDDNERSALADAVETEDEEVEAEERADLRPRLLLIDNLYEDEEELPPFVYSQEFDEYY